MPQFYGEQAIFQIGLYRCRNNTFLNYEIPWPSPTYTLPDILYTIRAFHVYIDLVRYEGNKELYSRPARNIQALGQMLSSERSSIKVLKIGFSGSLPFVSMAHKWGLHESLERNIGPFRDVRGLKDVRFNIGFRMSKVHAWFTDELKNSWTEDSMKYLEAAGREMMKPRHL
jgi:hypothetical protein